MKNVQHSIYKITSSRLRMSDWDLKLSYSLGVQLDEVIALFDSQMFRIISKLSNLKPIENVVFVEISNKKDFLHLCRHGFALNGEHFSRFVGTTGGLKNRTLIFVNSKIVDQLNEYCECGRNKNYKLVGAKYEAYKALIASASVPIGLPRNILVVKDCFTKFKSNVVRLDNSVTDRPTLEYLDDYEIEQNATDGFNLCTIEYMEEMSNKLELPMTASGVCIRAPWTKGMLYPFPIKEFAAKYGIAEVEDIWGNIADIDDVDIILTESSFKLWSAYGSIGEYLDNCEKYGLEFSVTKESGIKIDEEREINYQYLQSYELTPNQIEKISQPTVNWIKGSMTGDYEKTLEFIGADEDNDNELAWIKALKADKEFLSDKYIIQRIKKLIKKKLDDAKLGKLKMAGNYQTASGDPYLFMQHVCGIEPTGLLKADECYSSFWVDKGVDEILALRSPMTNMANIRKCKVVQNKETDYWYKYMKNIFIINSFDAFCIAENGEDFDGDTNYTTNNEILLKAFKTLPAIICVQQTSNKEKITKKVIEKSNWLSMGIAVGSITNKVTSMFNVLANLSDEKSIEEISYRIMCGQLYQQSNLDKMLVQYKCGEPRNLGCVIYV